MRKITRHILSALIGVCLASAGSAQEGNLRLLDFRIVLAQLAQKVGANGQIAILQAQGDTPGPALVLRGGRLALSDLAAAAPEGLTRKADGSYHLTRPLLVWPDSHLVIEPGEHLFLDRSSGAFLASLGQLEINGAMISAAPRGVEAARAPFHPFVLVAGQGYMRAHEARFAHLGFGTIPSFAGVAIINRGIFPANGNSRVSGSVFEHIGSLSLISVDDATLDGNLFEDTTDTSLVVRASNRIEIAGSAITDPNGHGIRIAEGSTDIRVDDTTLSAPQGIGIMVDSRAAGVSLSNNTIIAPQASGITLDTAFCLSITNNSILGSQGSGITVKASARVALSDNTVTRSKRAGITLQTQPKDADVALTGNRLIENRAGIKGTSSGTLRLANNDFSDQFPRFLDGDLMLEARRVAQDLRGITPVLFDGAHAQDPLLVPDCTMPGGA